MTIQEHDTPVPHKCEPIAVIQHTDPGTPEERRCWVGQLVEPLNPKDGWWEGADRERYCLHWKTPVQDIAMILDGEPDATAFQAIALVLNGGKSLNSRVFREHLLKWCYEMKGVYGAPAGKERLFPTPSASPPGHMGCPVPASCVQCETLRPYLDWERGECSRCGADPETGERSDEDGDDE